MSKTSFFYFSLVALLAGSFSSCREADLGFSEEQISYAATQRDYTKNFEKTFGKMDPNHTWGFGSSTRADAWNDGEHAYYKVNRTRIAREDNLNEAMNGYETGPLMSESDFYYYKSMLPDVVTEDEARYVMRYIHDNPDKGFTTQIFSTYYMQPVGKKKHTYKDAQNQDVVGCKQMDYLYVDQEHNLDYNGDVCGWVFNEDDEWTVETYGNPQEVLVVHSQTVSPSYKDSYDGAKVMQDHFKYYSVQYNGKWGLYLAFDYASDKDGYKVDADEHYDDWVVKITAAHHYTDRVLCEDLGSIHDWDFNDLVFDYCIDDGVLFLDVRALSGTLPLYWTFENKTYPIIGTHRPSGAERGHRYNCADAKGDDLTKNLFAVVVGNKRITDCSFFAIHNNTEIWKDGIDNLHTTDFSALGGWGLNNTPQCAPSMIQVPTTVDWPDEEQDISVKYPKFSNYVTDSSVKFWEN